MKFHSLGIALFSSAAWLCAIAQLSYSSETSNGWEVNVYANYFSGARRALFTLADDTPREFSPSWISFDLGLRIPVTRGLGLTVFLENLADRSYERVNRIFQPGLTYRIGLVSDF
ncbi:TonB-dependent receptor [Leptolyngbya sp. NIES-3755]|nr:TonB-dependent receptor [Leptolyngbya sp. NIES-3755]